MLPRVQFFSEIPVTRNGRENERQGITNRCGNSDWIGRHDEQDEKQRPTLINDIGNK